MQGKRYEKPKYFSILSYLFQNTTFFRKVNELIISKQHITCQNNSKLMKNMMKPAQRKKPHTRLFSLSYSKSGFHLDSGKNGEYIISAWFSSKNSSPRKSPSGSNVFRCSSLWRLYPPQYSHLISEFCRKNRTPLPLQVDFTHPDRQLEITIRIVSDH